MNSLPLPSAAHGLSRKERDDLLEYIYFLLHEGRHLEASTLKAKYFPLI